MPSTGDMWNRLQSCESWIGSHHVILHGIGKKPKIKKDDLMPLGRRILKDGFGFTPNSAPLIGLVRCEQIGGSLKLRFATANVASDVLRRRMRENFNYQNKRITVSQDETIEQRQERAFGMDRIAEFNKGQTGYTARWRRDIETGVGKIMVRRRTDPNAEVRWRFIAEFTHEFADYIESSVLRNWQADFERASATN